MEAQVEQRLTDGRRRRTSESRSRIVAAMLGLIRSGDVNPSAAQVADAAGVGLRSVFRHFDDMEQLYREMAQIVAAKIQPMIAKPPLARNWRARLIEISERRMTIYDGIMPIKVAASIRRFQSAFLMEDYRRHLRMERKSLESILPEKILKDPALFRAIEMVTGFQAWRRLRQDQSLSTKEARKVTLLLLDRLVPAID
jgi:AcrR family transcriptional regulator